MLNLYDILKKVLKEEVSAEKVNDAMNNKYQVIINYSDEENRAPRKRIIEPYAYGISKAGNEVLRAYQYNGDTYRGVPKWKLFRLDRIQSWTPTDRHFNMPPDENGWNAEAYNETGDKTMQIVLNQVNFDKTDTEDFSPNNSLNVLRKRTDNMKNSTPININQMKDNNRVETDAEFRKMLKRNLDITNKEKAKRGFSLSNTKNDINNSENNKDISDVMSNNQKNEPIVTNSIQKTMDDNNIENNKDEDFQKMLQRNLAITDKEKAKRGFSLHNK